ncbi:hypothetical protein CEXT_459171 [Caerostris extrusa]|uniref:Uncharacterized protein n=1 Tax=Caerostris extrusa TaxID=172846 RepID=A0AAV4QBU3_CAEEX|nr:hypothetical protein CEXT_459171 [Caerostris extrusa]
MILVRKPWRQVRSILRSGNPIGKTQSVAGQRSRLSVITTPPAVTWPSSHPLPCTSPILLTTAPLRWPRALSQRMNGPLNDDETRLHG